LLRWFRKFRTTCPKGTMTKEQFFQLWKEVFPLAEDDAIATITFEIFGQEEDEELDFKVIYKYVH